MGILSGNPKNEPMHYGEVFLVWSFLHAEYGMRVCNQTFLNHTGDHDLRKFIEDKLDFSNRIIKQLEEVLKENGVALPPSPPEKPVADLESIPAGARFSDVEIGAAMMKDNAAGLIACSKVMAASIREDIGAIFGKFHVETAAYGLRILRLHKEKGWLVPPPLHLHKPEQ